MPQYSQIQHKEITMLSRCQRRIYLVPHMLSRIGVNNVLMRNYFLNCSD